MTRCKTRLGGRCTLHLFHTWKFSLAETDLDDIAFNSYNVYVLESNSSILELSNEFLAVYAGKGEWTPFLDWHVNGVPQPEEIQTG